MGTMDSRAAPGRDPRHGDSSEPNGAADVTRLQDFLQRAAGRKEQQAADPQRFHGSWYDPDEQALTKLPSERHPVTVFIDETRARRRAKKKNEIRRVLSLLTGTDKAKVSWDDVLAFAWHHVGPDEAHDYYRAVRRAYPNRKTQHGYIVTLRSILNRCRQAKVLSPGRLAEIHDELPTTSKQGVAQRRRRLTSGEVADLIRSCAQDTPLRAARDAAMVAVFVTTGMRVCELVGLDLADWDRTTQTLLLLDTKNGSDHEVPVDPRTQRYLEAWLEHRGIEPGPLFVSTEGTPHRLTELRRLTTHAVIVRVQLLANRADIGHMGTHDFRRTVASTLLRTTDASLVGRLLNHTNLATTLGYDMATEDEQRNAIGTLPLPEVDGNDDDGQVAS